MMNLLKLSTLFITNFITLIIIINLIPSYYKLFHPLILGSILMLMNMLTSINISMYMYNNWWSYITFLVMVGGMMILFLYFTSFINNMIISMKIIFFKNLIFKSLIFLIFMIIMFMNYKKFLIWSSSINLNEINMNLYNKNLSKFIIMYTYNLNYNMIICLIYLLISLFLIVKMIISNKYSLRKMN
uniref:NADH dehydrogenase subunit 6 n=1 Tax=Cheiloneurus elegans TaxID=1107371 RepID=UPI00233F4498|nr:NADH dehydrogenase subunit 6 [Cheiloneurus elegans]WBR65753.1 NADH dehydrogenase subunit 6 [Cheiloneurus elegans]